VNDVERAGEDVRAAIAGEVVENAASGKASKACLGWIRLAALGTGK
jgi:hypothetical protein